MDITHWHTLLHWYINRKCEHQHASLDAMQTGCKQSCGYLTRAPVCMLVATCTLQGGHHSGHR